MNPAYRHARFRADLPHGGLPESFAVITACNPEGRTLPAAENILRTQQLEEQLIQAGYHRFPVTGFDAQSDHEERGFGVQCELEAAYALATEWRQEAIFWIHRGQVSLIQCGAQMKREALQTWAEMTEAPARDPHFHFHGPLPLLSKTSTAFLCSSRCPADKIEGIYDWARHQCDTGGTVISGFHTPIEQDVLEILARRGANILQVPARDLPKQLPRNLNAAHEEGRLLVLSPFNYGTTTRATRASCSVRNRFVLRYASATYLPHVGEGSSLALDLATHLL